MELALDVKWMIYARIWARVSILVFVELALDGQNDYLLGGRLQVVSILVFVELALDVQLMIRYWKCFLQVSILVFVELALDDRITLSSMTSKRSFNPCFRGTCS